MTLFQDRARLVKRFKRGRQVCRRRLQSAHGQVAFGQVARELWDLGLDSTSGPQMAWAERKASIACALRADFAGDLSDSKVGVGQLLAKQRVVFPLIGELLVIGQRTFEQIVAQAADVDRVLLFQKSVFADVRQVVFDGLLGHVEIDLGFLAGEGFAASRPFDDHGGDSAQDGEEQGEHQRKPQPCQSRVSLHTTSKPESPNPLA